jgi:ankyrin repeat protein
MTGSDSGSMLADVMSYLSFLLCLIETQDWIKFEEVALSNPKTFQLISQSISQCEEFNGMTLLHACVRYNPPPKLLKSMIETYPPALMAEDCLGRTPLHVAAGCGVDLWNIKLLTVNYPQACNIQDEDGRTPLHFACDTSCELFEDAECEPRSPPSLDVIRVLLAGSLDAVTLEDEDEMNAVEYAIVSDAPIEVVKLLQKATQRVLKRGQQKRAKVDGPSSPTLSRNVIPRRISASC